MLWCDLLKQFTLALAVMFTLIIFPTGCCLTWLIWCSQFANHTGTKGRFVQLKEETNLTIKHGSTLGHLVPGRRERINNFICVHLHPYTFRIFWKVVKRRWWREMDALQWKSLLASLQWLDSAPSYRTPWTYPMSASLHSVPWDQCFKSGGGQQWQTHQEECWPHYCCAATRWTNQDIVSKTEIFATVF